MTHRRDALSGASFFAACPVSPVMGVLVAARVRASRAKSSLRCDFAVGNLFTLTLRFGLDASLRSFTSRPEPFGETKKGFLAPACCRAVRPAFHFCVVSAGVPVELFSLLPAAFRFGADGSRSGSVGAALRNVGRVAPRISRGACIQRFARGKLKKEIAASLILRFNERRNSRIVRCDKVCVCRTAQPAAARPQTPLQGGSAPVDPRDDRSERTR